MFQPIETSAPFLVQSRLISLRSAYTDRPFAPTPKNVVACTVGFVSDHLEVLFDLGIEARDLCKELGLEFRRAATIGDDPKVMDALAGEVAKLYEIV